MSFPSLWHSLAILPLHHVVERSIQPEPFSLDNERHLPRWEQFPRRHSNRDSGSMDQDWIRRHLP